MVQSSYSIRVILLTGGGIVFSLWQRNWGFSWSIIGQSILPRLEQGQQLVSNREKKLILVFGASLGVLAPASVLALFFMNPALALPICGLTLIVFFALGMVMNRSRLG